VFESQEERIFRNNATFLSSPLAVPGNSERPLQVYRFWREREILFPSKPVVVILLFPHPQCLAYNIAQGVEKHNNNCCYKSAHIKTDIWNLPNLADVEVGSGREGR